MKLVLVIVISSFLIFGCQAPLEYDAQDLSLKLSKKELTKLFEGQELYSIKGIKSKFEGKNVRVKSISSDKDYILHLDLNNSYFRGSKELLLHSNTDYYKIYKSLQWFIDKNKLIWPKTEIVTINFNKGLRKNFTLLSVIDKESIEFGENRFVQKLAFITKNNKFEIEESEVESMVDFNSCFDYDYNSLVLLHIYLQETNIKLNSLSGIKLVPNPLSNLLEFVLDYSHLSVDPNGIGVEEYIGQIGQVKEVDPRKFKKALADFELQRDLHAKDVIQEIEFKEFVIENKLDLFEDLVLSNVDLKIKEGALINLHDNSKIIVKNGLVTINGTKSNPVYINGLGDNSIFVDNVKACLFNYTNIKGLSNWVDDCKSVPSAITLYNSNGEFNFCRFQNNIRGDDMINLFQSNYLFKECLFVDVLSDALDSDFSNGTIINTTYRNIGNDAVDCSGSLLDIKGSNFINISDKAISAGENSNIKVEGSVISSSAIGFVSKDGSQLTVGINNKLIENDLDFAIFMKKDFYRNPSLNFNGKLNSYKYLLQENSIIMSEDQDSSLIFLEEVQSKLYGNEYGKSSK